MLRYLSLEAAHKPQSVCAHFRFGTIQYVLETVLSTIIVLFLVVRVLDHSVTRPACSSKFLRFFEEFTLVASNRNFFHILGFSAVEISPIPPCGSLYFNFFSSMQCLDSSLSLLRRRFHGPFEPFLFLDEVPRGGAYPFLLMSFLISQYGFSRFLQKVLTL